MALLQCRDLTKKYGGNPVLRGVSFAVEPGEVHSLVGENGAGKSTLMHLLAGVRQPDAGVIEWRGRAVAIPDRHAAQKLGIAIVYQERSLFSLRTISENLFVNQLPVNRLSLVDWSALREQARRSLQTVGLDIDPDIEVGSLSPAEQQMVEIAKALTLGPEVLILDEPTAALTIAETQTLFHIVRKLQARGVGIIYISHRLEEIFALGGRVTVLRDGSTIGTWPVSQVNEQFLVSKMVGREKLEAHAPKAIGNRKDHVRLRVRNLSDDKLRGITFDARAGEILGFAGLSGAGRTEMAMSIFGARQPANGEVFVDDALVARDSPEGPIAAGIGYVPEDRGQLGLFLNMSIEENIGAASLASFGGWQVSDSRMRACSNEFVERLSIQGATKGNVRCLSGGNQQKVLLARWLARRPKVLIADEPTRGVDVHAKAQIHAAIRQFADAGAAVIVISSDLLEILAVSDRICVLREGALVATLDGRTATEEMVVRYAATESVVVPTA